MSYCNQFTFSSSADFQKKRTVFLRIFYFLCVVSFVNIWWEVQPAASRRKRPEDDPFSASFMARRCGCGESKKFQTDFPTGRPPGMPPMMPTMIVRTPPGKLIYCDWCCKWWKYYHDSATRDRSHLQNV